MVPLLAFLEGSSLFAAVSGMIFLWTHPLMLDWVDAVTVLGQALSVSLCCIVAFYYNDLYDFRIVRNFAECASRLLQAFGMAFILLAIFYSLFPDTRLAQGPFISSFLIIAGFLLPLRALSYAIMRSRPFMERVLILGTSPLAQKIVQEIEALPHFRYAVVGVVGDASPDGEPLDRYAVGRPLEELGRTIEELHPHRIVVALSERRGRLPFRQLLQARVGGILVEDGEEIYERLTGKLAIESLIPSYLIFSRDFKKSRLELMVSRALSLVISAVALVGLSPLLAMIALTIKLDSRGRVFIVQERVGMHGKRFKLAKLRTMHPVDGESSMWFHDNSNRITRIGKWLRKFRLDEFPQFMSVLRGDMNLVGPRPHRVPKFDLFAETIPYFSLRSVVPPGLTGWAQVRYGYASDPEEEMEKVRYDLYYIKHLSLWFDLRILFDTAKIILFGRGSAATAAPRTSARDRGRPERVKIPA